MNPNNLIILLSLLALPLTVSAKKGDGDQPIHVSADRVIINQQKQESTYSGDVVIIQGTMRLDADLVTIYGTRDKAEKLVAFGRPAHYRQDPDNPQDGEISAHADQIEYITSSELVTLLGKANIQQKNDQFSGERIVYNARTEQVKADGNNQQERVKLVLEPKKDANNKNKQSTNP